MGGMGGAQPLAATMTGASFLGVEVDPERIKRRLKSGYCDFMVNSLDEALRILKNAVRKKENVSVGLVGNCADVIPELARARRGAGYSHRPDLGARSAEWLCAERDDVGGSAGAAGARSRRRMSRRSLESIARHVEGMLRLQKMGAVTFDYGNNIRTFAFQQGVKNAYDFPGFVPEYIRPLFCEGRGPFRWVALSGEAADIAVTDDLVLELFPENEVSDALDRAGAEADSLSGTAGAHLLAGIWRAGGVRAGD